ncbi:acid phosphatase 1-like isoform X2 [Ananas comosus]|uniref:Acid phosphatase 1-like isoform X2 n=1 Tax=Ananas comosus TaxID=4615 RepID=A0A6P5F7U7_ANACO|nr:acid phosphatase 1-like isoform X2 [Ananas comosus]
MRLLRSHLLLLLLASSAAGSLLRTVPEEPSTISSGGGGGGGGDALYCDSWRLSVETNDAGPWTRIPARCIAFVDEYMNGERYASDSEVIAGEALAFAEAVEVAGDGKDVWVFDVDETLLSNLPYYAANGYGSQDFNETSFDEWVYLSKAPALSASLKLYTELQALGFHMVLLTGRAEVQRNATEQNLLFAGYGSWTQLILRIIKEGLAFVHRLDQLFFLLSQFSGICQRAEIRVKHGGL